MKFRKIFSYVILGIIFSSLGFGGGYLLGSNAASPAAEGIQKETIELVDSYIPDISEEAAEISPPSEKKTYFLKNEDEMLKLYEVNGEAYTLIKSIGINSQFLPSEDRERLKTGIILENIEDGFSLIEDFSS